MSLSSLKETSNSNITKEIVLINNDILSFFKDIEKNNDTLTIDSIYYGNISISTYLIDTIRQINNPINLGVLLHGLIKIIKNKKIGGDIQDLYKKIFKIILQKKDFLFKKKWNTQSIGDTLYGFHNSSNVPYELYEAFAIVISKAHNNWTSQQIGMSLYGIKDSTNVPYAFFEGFMKVIPTIQNWHARSIGNALYGLQNSSNVPLELFEAFAKVIPTVKSWDGQSIGNALYGIRNFSTVPVVFFEAFAKVIPTVQDWTSQHIGMSLYGIRNLSTVPVVFFEAFAKVISKTERWDAHGIGNALSGISHFDSAEVDSIIGLLIEKCLSLDIDREGFMGVQSLIIGLNHASVDIPEYINSRWNTLVEDKGKSRSTVTLYELNLFQMMTRQFSSHDMEILSGAYLQGYEVDIIILDSSGKVFAIIESDGYTHDNCSKQITDNKRDQYFLREGITDLIIRVSKKGCRVIELQ